MRPARSWPAVAALVLAATTACGGPTLTPAPTGDLTVLADSSLTEAFTAAGRDFETANPGLRVTFTFGGSGQLAGQVTDGAAADVFAAAGPAPMQEITDARRADGEPSAFATNDLVIAVPTGNPAGVADLHALARLRVAVCVASEPCGVAARAVLSAAAVSITPAAEEPDVKATLDQVLTGQADAALVFRTDARAVESKVDTIEFIESVQARQSDQIVALTAAPNQTPPPNLQAARAFVAYLTSERGRAILAAAGFREP